KALASGAFDRTVRLWEVATGKGRGLFYERTNSVYALAFSPDGQTLATTSEERVARVWDLTSPSQAPALPLAANGLEPLWTDLGDQDAARAYQAICKLVAAHEAVPFLRERLLEHGKAEPVDPNRLARLLAD